MKTLYGKQVCENLTEVLEPDGCAVLAVDMQNDFVRSDGIVAKAGGDVSGVQEMLPRCRAFLDDARDLGVTVMYLRQIELPGGRSSSPAYLRFSLLITGQHNPACVEGTWGAEFCSEVAPRAGEIVITKHRSSGFRQTNLDLVLKANSLRTVVIIGDQTPGCVDATLRDATYHDYYGVLIEDCVAGFNRELHSAALKVQKARHDHCTAAEAVGIWRAARSQGRLATRGSDEMA